MRRLQIGVIGSCSDLNYSQAAMRFATELGKLIAEAKCTLIFGAEKDVSSLPTIAALAAKNRGGETVGVTYEKGLDVFSSEAASVIVASGLVRGGGRETVLMLSCDVVIAIAGGSGTLNEICVAYQANIPVITVNDYGGWSEKLAGTYLDDRKRYKFVAASNPASALSLALGAVKK
ncbi:hypothetical protein EOL96_03860 [Candidatus Saccharibacteria bacterium]|nr:hypothetical protein [Candidatus Saccharibacteria bacterium]